MKKLYCSFFPIFLILQGCALAPMMKTDYTLRQEIRKPAQAPAKVQGNRQGLGELQKLNDGVRLENL